MEPAGPRPTDAPGQSDRTPLLQEPVAKFYDSNEKNIVDKEFASPLHEAEIGETAPPCNVVEKGQVSKAYAVVIFCLTAGLLFADQNLMAPNLTSIAKSFGFSEDERDRYLGGYIAAAFYLFGAPAAILFGYLSHTVSRRALFLLAVLLGEGPCLLTIFVTRYWELFFLRLLTGISIGGSLPLIFSLLSDMYEHRHRAFVSAIVQVAVGAGIAVGQGVAGYVGPLIGWRWPFVIVAVPAIISSLVMFWTTQEPVRGSTEAAFQEKMRQDVEFSYHGRFSRQKLVALLRIRTNVLAIGQGLPGCLPWGMLLTFLNDYLAQDKGLSISSATSLVLCIGIGGALGVIGGGVLGQYLYNNRPKYMPVFIGTMTIIGTLPMWYLVKADIKSHYIFSFVNALLAGFLSSTVGPNVRAMIMNVNEPETRGLALAFQTTLDDLGKGLGPAVVAMMISTLGRESAFFWATAGWIPCGALLLMTAFTLEGDEQAMQSRLKARMSLAATGSELEVFE